MMIKATVHYEEVDFDSDQCVYLDSNQNSWLTHIADHLAEGSNKVIIVNKVSSITYEASADAEGTVILNRDAIDGLQELVASLETH